MKYSYAVFPKTRSTSIRSIRSTSGNTQGHYRDEVFVCKSDVGPSRALLPAFVKEDTQPIAEIPIQKIETKKRQFKHMLVLKQLRYSIMYGQQTLIQNPKNVKTYKSYITYINQTWNLSKNLHDLIFGRKNFTH